MEKYDDDNAASTGHGTSSGNSSPASASEAPPTAGVFSGVAAAARAGWEAENRAAAQRLSAAHRLMVECLEHPDCRLVEERPGFAVVDPLVMACSYLVRLFPISSYKAEAMISFAADLHFRYPAILEAMSQGRMDQAAAHVVAGQMGYVADEVLPVVQQAVVDDYLAAVEAGERPGVKAVAERADRIIATHDPAGVRQRKADAGRERGARIAKGRDGMAMLYALLHAEEAAVLAEALEERIAVDRAAEEHAADQRAAEQAAAAARDAEPAAETSTANSDPASGGDDYSVAQRRADALLSLVCGDATRPGNSAGGGVTLRPKITVIAPRGGPGQGFDPSAGTSPGSGSGGGWADRVRVDFARTGEAAVQALLDMLATSGGASLQQIDPAIGAADDATAARRYRPGTALAQRIRLRDGACRHPGCAVPAQACDLDHVVPFDHAVPARGGPTSETNLACLCRAHHRFKTFNDWQYRLDADGTLTITTPQGQTMLTRPDGPLATYRTDTALAESEADDIDAADTEAARGEAAAWARQQARNPDPDAPATSATGADAATDEHATGTSWARRLARQQARRQRHRTRNSGPGAGAGTRPGGFCPITVTTRPRTLDLPTRPASRWWHDNHHRYTPAAAGNGSRVERRLRAELELIYTHDTPRPHEIQHPHDTPNRQPHDPAPDRDDPPPF